MRNSTERKHRATHFQELREGAPVFGQWAEKDMTDPLGLPCVLPSVNPHPCLFYHQCCELSAQQIDLGFISLSCSPAHTLMVGLRISKTAKRQAVQRSGKRADGTIMYRGCSDVLMALVGKLC